MHTTHADRAAVLRWLWQIDGIARTSGALFLRSYERGEWVYIAMLARDGFAPELPDGARVAGRVWAPARNESIAASVICAAPMGAT